MSPIFLELLVHPINKTPLQYHHDRNEISDKLSQDIFKVKEDVPILLLKENTIQKRQDGHSNRNYVDHYQRDAEVYEYEKNTAHPIEQTEIDFLRKNILANIPENVSVVLDIGCGGAWLAKNLLPTGKSVISTDISDINPIKAIKNFSSKNHFGLVADVFQLPLKESSIDCVIASEIIEHVDDPIRFISCLLKVIKKGGCMIITTPYNELIRTSLCIHCNKETPHNAHLHSFNEKTFQNILPSDISSKKILLLNSKLFVQTRLQFLLRFLPLKMINLIDRLFIFLTRKKAYRIMVVLKK
jgi:2-polyprenyl-3-methyl-5-hydroxy-6-metoxy-1,4-benzoquinol methylase